MNLRFVLSGGPGAGKTTVLAALAVRGHHSVPESARAIIQERLEARLAPRPTPVEFAREILHRDTVQYRTTRVTDRPVFFDRGVVDALGMLHQSGALPQDEKAHYLSNYQYNSVVFMLPPWRHIYRNDTERDQTFAESVQVFEELRQWYTECHYHVLELPRMSVDERVAFVRRHVQGHSNA